MCTSGQIINEITAAMKFAFTWGYRWRKSYAAINSTEGVRTQMLPSVEFHVTFLVEWMETWLKFGQIFSTIDLLWHQIYMTCFHLTHTAMG